MKNIIILQNPNLVKVGGFENLNKSLYNNTAVGFQIPFVNNKFKTGLTEAEKKRVENHYNMMFDTPEGRDFYAGLSFTISDRKESWNLENPELLLKYKTAMELGILAKDRVEIDNPLCQAIFYVYDPEEENQYVSEQNELKGEVLFMLTDLKKSKPKQLITFAKYIFTTYEVFTPSRAYNRLVEMADAHSKTNRTLNKLYDILTADFEDIDLTVVIREAINKNLIIKNNRAYFANRDSSTEYGKNEEEIKEFLLNNPDELGEGKATDKLYALRRLLKEYNNEELNSDETEIISTASSKKKKI